MKITESKIREIIRFELARITEQIDAVPLMGDPSVIAHKASKSVKSKSKSKKDSGSEFTIDNDVWEYITGDKNIGDTINRAWKVTKGEAQEFSDDPGYYTAQVLDLFTDKLDKGMQFTEDQIDKIPGIESAPAWFPSHDLLLLYFFSIAAGPTGLSGYKFKGNGGAPERRALLSAVANQAGVVKIRSVAHGS